MYGQIHANYVLYRDRPERGHRYRQIVVHELDTFIVIFGEGDVVQDGAAFAVSSPDAEAGIHGHLRDAMTEAGDIFNRSVTEGWIPYQDQHP